MSDDDEARLKRELLGMDVDLRRKQVAWETPRNIAILAGAVAALAAAVGGVLGYRIGQQPSPPPVVIQLQSPPAPARTP